MHKIRSDSKIKLVKLFISKEKKRQLRRKIKVSSEYKYSHQMRGHTAINEIVIPPYLDFSENKRITLRFIEKFRQDALVDRKRVRLNFGSIRRISPAASIVLLAEIDRCWKVTGKKVFSLRATRNRLTQELDDMGFFKLLDVDFSMPFIRKRANPNKRYLKFRSAIEDIGEFAHQMREAVYDQSPDILSTELRDKLYTALTESMSNVSRHAYSPEFAKNITHEHADRRWWMSGYIDKLNNEVMLQFYDQGAGIPNTLPSLLTERIAEKFMRMTKNRDSMLIKQATALGASATKEPHRGKGLPQIVDVINGTERGRLRIISNCGDYVLRNNPTDGKPIEHLQDANISLSGTLIQWRISDVA